jgi:hypothetical protein
MSSPVTAIWVTVVLYRFTLVFLHLFGAFTAPVYFDLPGYLPVRFVTLFAPDIDSSDCCSPASDTEITYPQILPTAMDWFCGETIFGGFVNPTPFDLLGYWVISIGGS